MVGTQRPSVIGLGTREFWRPDNFRSRGGIPDLLDFEEKSKLVDKIIKLTNEQNSRDKKKILRAFGEGSAKTSNRRNIGCKITTLLLYGNNQCGWVGSISTEDLSYTV